MSIFDWNEEVGGDRFDDAVGGEPVGQWTRLGFAIEQQIADQWCWAATTCGVASHYEPNAGYTQCGVAQKTLDRLDCCQGDPRGGPCDEPYQLNLALAAVGHLGSFIQGTLDEAVLTTELANNRPVGIRIEWEGGGGHFVVIAGFLGGTDPMVEVHDPAKTQGTGRLVVSYGDVVAAYEGLGSWSHSYQTKD